MRNTLYYRPLQRLDSPTDRKKNLSFKAFSAGKSFQSLEHSSRKHASKSPDSSSHWRNRPDQNPLSDPKHPVNGGITLLTDPFAS